MSDNPYAAPDPDTGIPAVRGRMPKALRRDMLKHEASVRALGAIYVLYAGF